MQRVVARVLSADDGGILAVVDCVGDTGCVCQ
jgi:hypothetical protein